MVFLFVLFCTKKDNSNFEKIQFIIEFWNCSNDVSLILIHRLCPFILIYKTGKSNKENLKIPKE